MPLSEEEKENMLDGFIEHYGQDNFSYSLRDVPLTKMKTDQAEPSTIDDLPVRPLPARHIANMFDVHKGIPGDISEEDIGRAMRDGNWDQLPEVVRPRAPLPEGAVLQWVIQRAADNTLNVLKHFIFDKKMRAAEAQDLVTGEASAPLWRANTWGVKKGYQAFMDNMPGYHVMYASLAQKMAKDHKESGWNPTAEEVKEGIMFINQKIPMDNSQLQQLEWIIVNIKNSSPILGWPMWVVQKAAAEKAKANSAVETEFFFPLCIFDVHPTFVDKILPLVIPLCTSFGILLLGNPGVGKTPLAMILAMAVGRMHCRRRGISTQPGWRRCKQFDGFRNKPGQVQEAIILDDADIASINVEDVKSFGDVGEAGVCDARYSPAKFAKNSLHLLLNNTWEEGKEPTPLLDCTITHEEFMGMVGKSFGYLPNPHLMAVFKRYVTVIGGKHAVYVRPPGKGEDVPIYAFAEGNVARDWLLDPGNKASYAQFKKGEKVTYDGFEAALRREQEYVDNLMNETGDMLPPEIVEW